MSWTHQVSGILFRRKKRFTFAVPLKDLDSLVVPTVSIYEVFKVLLRESGEEAALLLAAAAMQRGRLVDLTPQRALSAAAFSLKHSLPMADSIILAAAREHAATIWTQDDGLQGIEYGQVFSKKIEANQMNTSRRWSQRIDDGPDISHENGIRFVEMVKEL